MQEMQETRVRSLSQEDNTGGGNRHPLQRACLGNPMVRGTWQATVYGVEKSRTQQSTHTCITFSITKVNDHHLINYHFIYLSILWRPSTDDLDMTSVSPSPPPTRPTPTLPWSPRWYLPSHLPGNSLVVQWLELHTFTAEEAGSVPDRGTYKLWHALPPQKKIILLIFHSPPLYKLPTITLMSGPPSQLSGQRSAEFLFC